MNREGLTDQARKSIFEFSKLTWEGTLDSTPQVLIIQGPHGSGKGQVLNSLRTTCNPETTEFYDEGERWPGVSNAPFSVYGLRPGHKLQTDDDVPVTVVELFIVEQSINRGWYWLVNVNGPANPYPVFVEHANHERAYYQRMEPEGDSTKIYTGDAPISDLIPIRLPTPDDIPSDARPIIREIIEEDFADRIFAFT